MAAERSLRPHEQVVERTLEWVAIAVLALNLPLSTVRCLQNPAAYVPGFAVAVLLGFWGLLLQAVARRARQRTARAALRTTVGLGCVALLVHPVAQGPLPADYPPLLHVLGATAAVSPVLGVGLSTVLIPAFAAYVAFVRAPVLGTGRALSEAALLALSSLLATVTVDLLRRANRSVVRALAAVTSAAELEVRTQRRAYEREHWNGLVHDKVLGALQLVARSTSPSPSDAARELATQAVAALRGDPASTDLPLVDAVLVHARLLGLEVELAIAGDVHDAEVRAAFTDAAKEALTNVARHAGTRRAQVDGHLDDEAAELVVTDRGCGFDPSAAVADRGITTSLQGRMESVGGAATVTSRPGGGTSVRLTWTVPGREPDASDQPDGSDGSDADWQLRTFAPAMVVGGLAVAMNIVIGAEQWQHDRWPVLTALGIAAVLVVTATATLLKPRPNRWVPIVAAGVATAALLTADVAPGAGTDWRYWYLGALTPAVGAVSFRFRARAGLLMAGLLTATVCVVDAAVGRPWWSCLGGPVPVLLVIGIAGGGIRSAMDRAWQRVNDAEAERARIRLATAVDEERAREASARVATLTDVVGPSLMRICSAASVTDEERHTLELLAASIRDHLAAPDLLDAALVQSLQESRARGARIIVVPGAPENVTGGRPPLPEPALHRYRGLLAEALRSAASGATVRAVWGSRQPGSYGTISVVFRGADAAHDGAQAADRLDAVVGGLPAVRRPVVTRDETSLLVEFPR